MVYLYLKEDISFFRSAKKMKRVQQTVEIHPMKSVTFKSHSSSECRLYAEMYYHLSSLIEPNVEVVTQNRPQALPAIIHTTKMVCCTLHVTH
jgi:hypothetical protein